MLDGQQKTLELLDEQRSKRDPFDRLSQARKMSSGQVPSDVISEVVREDNRSKGNPQGNLVEGHSTVENSGPRSLRDFLTKADEQAPKDRFEGTDLRDRLGKLGLSDMLEGVPLNDFGKLQLMLKLRERFGEDFFSMSEARGAMTAFEEALKSQKEGRKEAFEKMLSQSKRTLGILFGDT